MRNLFLRLLPLQLLLLSALGCELTEVVIEEADDQVVAEILLTVGE